MVIRCSDFDMVREHTAIPDGDPGTIHHINPGIVQNEYIVSNRDVVVVALDNQLQAIQKAVIADHKGVSMPFEADLGVVQIASSHTEGVSALPAKGNAGLIGK